MKSRNFWPTGVALALLLFLGGMIGMVVLACSQRTDLVRSDYYEDEIHFQNQLDRAARTRPLAAAVKVDYAPAARQVRVTVPIGPEPSTGAIELYRPSAATLDRKLDFKPDAAGAQVIDAVPLEAGLWRIKISWTNGGLDYFAERDVVIEPTRR